ncbi:YdcF family protein [Stenotrophomonas sp. Marseille-Q4652]|uniref:YdcF family protein n=1 Tax=Stenotrophomonas sp. Marseille-Q4652 TaxID=2866595 RepID=UPI001CE47A45|nr:YdcF family protein [Stenotrophomonas sp. Marseille-Q4652]
MSRRRRSRRGLLGWAWRLGVIALLWLLGVAGWIVWVGDRDQAAPADAIIVLGAAAYDAKPSPVFEERIRHGLDLYRRGYAPVLIFTGGYGGAGARFAESQVARRYALRQQVPEEAILIETESRTTRQNLEQARALMRQHDLHRVIVVSDPLHMARALRLCSELGIDARASSTPSTRFRSFQTRWRFLAQEIYFFHRDLVLRGR